ncbi:MAG: hypothetical protein HFH49_11990 [Lachnospiraceae bacterium]|nr:hypothetical protein [Lachnospiraceae bacterium]
MDAKKVRGKIKRNYVLAEEIIKRWYESEHFIETGDVRIGTTEELLKVIHGEELLCRELGKKLPGMQSIEVCLTIYGECSYGKYKKYHQSGDLHLYAAEAVRILLRGISPERERQIIFSERVFELLEHIRIMVEAKEIAQMKEVGFLEDAKEIYLTGGYFSFSKRDARIMEICGRYYSGKGLRLRMGDKTSELLYRDLKCKNLLESEFVISLQKLLSGMARGRDISFFKGTYYEFFPSIHDCDSTYKDFLEILLEKIDFLITFEMLLIKQYGLLYSMKNYSSDAMARLFRCPFVIPNKIVKECLVFEPAWKRWHVTDRNEIKLLKKPVIRSYDGRCMTSFLLSGDAVNAWLEDAIYKESHSKTWKMQICQKIEALFEQEVVDYMRKHKFIAGRIEENGVWHNGIHADKNLGIVLPGEVDVFAVNDDRKKVYLIECKCIHDVLTSEGNCYQKFKNINKKLNGTYVQKIKKKRQVIEKYIAKQLNGYLLSTVILTDIDFPVYLLKETVNAWEKDIAICDFAALKESVEKNTFPKSCVQHI